jgi:protein-S-isoprenylcysteine O-methyltransferase Ste14
MLPAVTPWQLVAFAYAILARMAYVLFVGSVLRRQERGGSGFTHREFRWRAALVMNHDAFAFIVCCVVTRDTWALPVSWPVSFTVGAVLAVIGLGVKLWAARTLGSNAYYWHNFFEPERAIGPVSSGPYRFISSPMYTVGYLPTYGLALITRSFPGLIAAAFSQGAILTFYFVVEKPHFRRLHGSS